MNERTKRRTFFALAGALVVTSRDSARAQPQPATPKIKPTADKPSSHAPPEKEAEVSAVEDLMREHGVIRRVLVIYREAATRLRINAKAKAKAGSVPLDELQKAAKLMRAFGEDYHEKQLEEGNIFPMLMKSGTSLTGMVNALITQHQRGREITEYILAVTQKAIAAQGAEPLARTLEAFARMYEEHAAFEDTLVFPAWKKLLTPKDLDQMGERFEAIEHKTFGKDGFDDAVERVGAIERGFGIELAALTAPPVKT